MDNTCALCSFGARMIHRLDRSGEIRICPIQTDMGRGLLVSTPTPQGETWVRDFAGSRFRSFLRATSADITERFGPFTFLLGLHVANDALYYPVRRGWFLGLQLPRFVLPDRCHAHTSPMGDFISTCG